VAQIRHLGEAGDGVEDEQAVRRRGRRLQAPAPPAAAAAAALPRLSAGHCARRASTAASAGTSESRKNAQSRLLTILCR